MQDRGLYYLDTTCVPIAGGFRDIPVINNPPQICGYVVFHGPATARLILLNGAKSEASISRWDSLVPIYFLLHK